MLKGKRCPSREVTSSTLGITSTEKEPMQLVGTWSQPVHLGIHSSLIRMEFAKPMPRCSLRCGTSIVSMSIMQHWTPLIQMHLNHLLSNALASIDGFFQNFTARQGPTMMDSRTGISTKHVETLRISSSMICPIGTFGEAVDVFGMKQSLETNLLVSTHSCLLYTSPSPRDGLLSRMPSSA